MKILKDAFGMGLMDYLLGKKNNELLERDDGLLFHVYNGEYFTVYDDWPSYEKKAISHANGRVLDLGCGAGRHAIYLQEKGHDTLGIDSSAQALKICRMRGLRNVKNLQIEKLSPKLGKFDTVLMLGNNFGIFQSDKKARKVLSVLDKMTSPDAVILAESMDTRGAFGSNDGRYRENNVKKGLMPGHTRSRVLIRDGAGPWFDFLFVSKKEMEKILEGTAWKVKKFYGGFMPQYTAVIGKRK